MLTRRHVFYAGAAGLAALSVGRLTRPNTARAATSYEVTHTDEEWRKLLTPDQYEVLRREGTERPFTSPLLNEHRAGTFACAVYRRRGADAAGWVTYTDEQAHYAPARWVQRKVEETGGLVTLRASSMLMHLEAIRAGTGRGVLPCYVGDGHPLLERLMPPIPEIAADYWIIVHRDLRRAACVRAVIDWVKAVFAEHRDVLAGVPQGGTWRRKTA